MATIKETAQGIGESVGGVVAGKVGEKVVGAVTAAVGGLIQSIFGGGSKPTAWTNAPEDVRSWFKNSPGTSQAFLDWMRDKHPEGFATLDTIRAMRLLWLWEVDHSIIHPTDFPGDLPEGNINGARKFYATLGIDYDNSVKKIAANPKGWHGHIDDSEVVWLPGPSPVVQHIAAVNDKAKKGATLTKAEQKVLKSGDASTSNWMLIAIAAVLIFLAFKKGE